jgi:hypothetical protein
MDAASINWLIVLVFAIIGGGFIGLVMGHKIKDGPERLLTTPMIFQTGATNTVLVIIGLSLIALCFTVSVWHGVAAIALGFITESFIGAKVMYDEKGGIGKAIKTTIIFLLVVCLPFGGYQYYHYNRSPNEKDKLAFIYECDEYYTNEVFKGKRSRDTAKAICNCLWPDLVGRYGAMGKINDVARWSGSVTQGDKEFDRVSKVCLDDYHNRD